MTHPIDAAIAGLVATWDGAAELAYDVDGESTGLLVSDDPLLDGTDVRRLLLVGTSAQYLPGGAQANVRHGYGGRESVQVDIVCELTTWSGDTDAPAERTRAFDVLAALTTLLSRNRDLGGTADWARITRVTYEPGQADLGAAATVEFTVRVDATRFEED